MKKLLSLVLSLLMLMTVCPALAEDIAVSDVPAVQTMTSPDGTYSFEVPADYFTMNSEWFVSLMGQEEFQTILAQAMGLADVSMLEVYIQQMEASNMMIVYDPSFVANLNVQVTPGTMTMELVEVLKSAMDAAMVEQYVTLGVAEADITLMDIQQIGNYRWYGMKLVFAGTPMQTMITIVNGVQYTLTFTGMDEVVSQRMLETFAVQTVAAE